MRTYRFRPRRKLSVSWLAVIAAASAREKHSVRTSTPSRAVSGAAASSPAAVSAAVSPSADSSAVVTRAGRSGASALGSSWYMT